MGLFLALWWIAHIQNLLDVITPYETTMGLETSSSNCQRTLKGRRQENPRQKVTDDEQNKLAQAEANPSQKVNTLFEDCKRLTLGLALILESG